MSPFNQHTVAPTPMAEERARQTYAAEMADNPRRRGMNRAEENLAGDPVIPGSFVGGLFNSYEAPASSKNHNVQVHRQMAAGRGVQGRTNPPPTWAAVDQPTMDAFLQGGTVDETPVNPHPHPWAPRAGANPSPIGPTFGFNDGERPSPAVDMKIATPGRRRNEAAL